jgi:hypothetical protein
MYSDTRPELKNIWYESWKLWKMSGRHTTELSQVWNTILNMKFMTRTPIAILLGQLKRYNVTDMRLGWGNLFTRNVEKQPPGKEKRILETKRNILETVVLIPFCQVTLLIRRSNIGLHSKAKVALHFICVQASSFPRTRNTNVPQQWSLKRRGIMFFQNIRPQRTKIYISKIYLCLFYWIILPMWLAFIGWFSF